jgi:membrane protease YdiL (CAAX protease family)
MPAVNVDTMRKEVRNRLIASLILSSLFSLFIIFLIVFTNNFWLILSVPLFVLLSEFIFPKKQDLFVTLLLSFLFVYLNVLFIFSPFILSFLMFFIPVYYLRDFSSNNLILKNLGFNGSIVRALFYTLVSILPLFILYILIGILAYLFNLDDSQMVVDKVLDLPVYLWAYAILVAPLVEEVFFRSFLPLFFMIKTSFLSPLKSEIVSSFLATLLFSLAHISYGSFFELIGTFFMGYALYIIFRVSKDIKVAILIHMLINLVSIIAMHLVM